MIPDAACAQPDTTDPGAHQLAASAIVPLNATVAARATPPRSRQPAAPAQTEQRRARERRRASRAPVGDEFAARLWSSHATLAVLPVVNLSADGMLLASPHRLVVDSVSVELIGRMWRFVGRARVVGHAERCVHLHVTAWQGRARECIAEYVSVACSPNGPAPSAHAVSHRGQRPCVPARVASA